jgi:cyanophycinase-like exopeptidase
MTARLLTIMGSGETAPTMAKVHRALIGRVGEPAVLLDTPYGFQENADDISARAQEYFATSVGALITVASYRNASVDAATAGTAVARIRAAAYAVAGPGSPTYALAQWAGSPIPALLHDKLRAGGGVTFASAAALTLGIVTVPVYEIYKAGEPPAWRDGLNLLEQSTGLRAAVVPHYDNAEGGHHDTRFCYLGERRLAGLERELPAGAFVLGVDEHTAAVVDLDERTLAVVGLGSVSIRRQGASTVFGAGTTVGLDEIAATGAGRASAHGVAVPVSAAPPAMDQQHRSPLLADAARFEAAFDAALEARDVPGMVSAVLELDRAIEAWSADTLQSDEPDRARAVLRSMIVRLGDVAVMGAREPRDVVAPYVDLLLAVRARARDARDFALSDTIRDGLAAAGVEVRDTPDGAAWLLSG